MALAMRGSNRLFENMNKDIMKGEYSNTWSRFWDNVAMELYRFELGVNNNV